MKWTGQWILNNTLHPLHGRTGIVVVEAETSRAAAQQVRDEASRQLFGNSTLMQTYIEIKSLIQATG